MTLRRLAIGLIALVGVALLVALPMTMVSVKVSPPEGGAVVGNAPRVGVWLGAVGVFTLVGVATCLDAVGWLARRLIRRLRRA